MSFVVDLRDASMGRANINVCTEGNPDWRTLDMRTRHDKSAFFALWRLLSVPETLGCEWDTPKQIAQGEDVFLRHIWTADVTSEMISHAVMEEMHAFLQVVPCLSEDEEEFIDR